MRLTILLPALTLAAAALAVAQQSQPWRDQAVLHLDRSPQAKLRGVPLRAVKMTDGFWAGRRKANVEVSIPTLYQELESHGIVDNFRRLSGRKDVARRGPLYTDSDLYKWMEAVAFVLQTEDNPKLKALMESMITEVIAAQEPNGYLNTYFTREHLARRHKEMTSGHELYCLGHLIQAGIAYYRATGERRLMDAGIRMVDYLMENFGPEKSPIYEGHPEIELALVELYRTTGEQRFLDAARYMLNSDGRLKLSRRDLTYMFTGKPFTERTKMEGHAVRAAYAVSGATDYYLETGDAAYWSTLQRLWQDMTGSKMYVTGGIGSRASGEAFGDPYELPNRLAYTESCAAIGNMIWNWRMLAATGDARYTDVLERALYNSVNSGMSTEGNLYCYRNPLELVGNPDDKIRNPWYDTTCCPPNLERILASLPGYLYSTSDDGVYVHLYHGSQMDWRLKDGTALRMAQQTAYPWEGKIDLTVDPAAEKEFAVYLRIPGWTASASVLVNGAKATGEVQPGRYFAIKRAWKKGDRVQLTLDMAVRPVVSHQLVRENNDKVTVERGPLVYCMEQIDQPADTIWHNTRLVLPRENSASGFTLRKRDDLFGGVMTVEHAAESHDALDSLYAPLGRASAARPPKQFKLTLIPYYTFHNRGTTAMQVWIPYRQQP